MEWLDGAAWAIGVLLFFLSIKRRIQRQRRASRQIAKMRAAREQM